MSESPGDGIARRDELLELLFWLEGEGLTSSATVAGMARFMAHPEGLVRDTLADLSSRAYIMRVRETGEYRLTSAGRAEAARRFADDFSELLGQGHGECSDPDCDCHDNPAGAAECHAARAAGGHRH